MSKVAVVILADTESKGDLGRALNALEAVKEFKAGHDDVRLIFDGAGTKWIPELSKSGHMLNGLFKSVQDKVAGACSFCAGAFEVSDQIKACGVPTLGQFEQHPSFKELISKGYQVLTF